MIGTMDFEKGSLPYPLQGLRHLALRVTDLAKARGFYQGILGMKVVWEPDLKNVYLSSGIDNLALHEVPHEEQKKLRSGPDQPLDHLGFLVKNSEAVVGIYNEMLKVGVRIVKPLRQHRDGSHSFYMADPDGNVIQILYEPHISHLGLNS